MKKTFLILLIASMLAGFTSGALLYGIMLPKEPTPAVQEEEFMVYRLYPTKNMWNFIKLNTRNGKMWLVQYDVEGDNRMETILHILPLVMKSEEKNGRFALYATKNIWNFILLDQIDGRTWQVQWSLDPENIGIWRIE